MEDKSVNVNTHPDDEVTLEMEIDPTSSPPSSRSKSIKRDTSSLSEIFPDRPSPKKEGSHFNDHCHAYKKISELIFDPTPGSKYIVVTVAAVAISVFASYYNYSLARDYVVGIGKQWGMEEPDAELLGTLCGVVGLIINTSIGTVSAEKGYYDIIEKTILDIKEKVMTQLKLKDISDNKGNTSDSEGTRLSLIIFAILAVIGALPNIKIVYDNQKTTTWFKVLQIFAQGGTAWAQNLRGLRNIFTSLFSEEMDKAAQQFKLKFLQILNKCLDEKERATDKGLEALSQGKTMEETFPFLNKYLFFIMGLPVAGYSSAFYEVAKSVMPTTKQGNILGDGLAFLGTGVSFATSMEKWCLLTYAYRAFFLLLFELFIDKPIFPIQKGYLHRWSQRGIMLGSACVSLLSLGSASRVVQKYTFEDNKNTSTFAKSFALGGTSAYGIHTNDFYRLIERVLDKARPWLKERKGDFSTRLGATRSEMIMRAMLNIATMPSKDFLDKFTKRFETVQELHTFYQVESEEEGLPPDQIIANLIKTGAFMRGRIKSNYYKEIEEAANELIGSSQDESGYNSFVKQFGSNPIKKQEDTETTKLLQQEEDDSGLDAGLFRRF